MDITIIGASDMFARGFATWAVAGGHNVTVVGPGVDRPEAFMKSVGAVNAEGRYKPLRDQMIFLALPYVCVYDVLSSYGAEAFKGKLVVDLTIPIDPGTFEPIHPGAGSVAQEIKKAVAVSVVKAFNPMFAGALMATKTMDKEMREILLASDDKEAKRAVAGFFEEGGLHPVDVGPLRRAKEIEAFGYLRMATRQPNLLKLF